MKFIIIVWFVDNKFSEIDENTYSCGETSKE